MKEGRKTGKISIGVLSAIAGTVAGGLAVARKFNREVNKWKTYSNKHLQIMKLYDQWMAMKQEHKSMADYLEKNSITTVAIYGMSFVGERLYEELRDTNIEVKYAIDRNADNIYADVNVITPEEHLEEVDAIIVTAVYYFDDIEEELSKLTDAPILSLEDILYEL